MLVMCIGRNEGGVPVEREEKSKGLGAGASNM